jgi:lipoprotein-releasing system ATP-binding protein
VDRSADASTPLLAVRHLSRVLGEGEAARPVLEDVSLGIGRGELVALTGPSGSGKSTLLYLLGALDRPTSGEVWLDGVELSGLEDDERAALRRERLGFVFQFHFLLPELTARENVMVPMMRLGTRSRGECAQRGGELLELFGLGELADRKPGQLSGGQQQRVAVARAIANDPIVVLADEPTGNLDSANAERVFRALTGLAREQGRSVLMVTHDPDMARRADRQIRLRDGRIVAEEEER